MKLYALLGAVCLLGACHDDFGYEGGIKVIPGEEIQFGATAHFEDGNRSNTRTEYGDISGGKIEVNWVSNVDRIQIASPHANVVNSTTGVNIAEYMVTDATGGWDGEYAENSKATTLTKIGESGLQWTNEEQYEFYAIYPSHNQLAEVLTEVTDKDEYGLKYTFDDADKPMGVLTGYLPTRQDPSVDISSLPGNDVLCVIPPDMRYAYMVAKELYTVPEAGVIDEQDDTDKINLAFSSLVTALEFDITASDIGWQEATSTAGIWVTALSLYSASGKDICGKFEYTFPQGDVEDVTKGSFKTLNEATGYNQIVMEFGDNGVPLIEGKALDATFFLLPSVDVYSKSDLKLTIHYRVNGRPHVKTATINKELHPRKKYYFQDLMLPPIQANVSGSTWWEALDPNTYLSQVSIPVASNVFASSLYFKGDTYKNLLQQVKSYTELWDMGVRGFEFVNRKTNVSTANQPSASLGSAHFVVDENPLATDTINFGKAFNTLVGKLHANPKECLVLICTYQAIQDGYNPNVYVNQLINYLDDYVAEGGNDYGITQDDFVQIKAESTVGDIQGKIAIIIRPGDDDRYETNSTTASIKLTNNASTSDWSDHLTLIQDWGTAFDVWDRRYNGVAREAQFETQYRKEHKPDLPQRPLMEDWLWGAGAGDSGDFDEYNHNGTTDAGNNAFDNFGSDVKDKPEPLATFNYAHPRANGGTAYVQEWARVVPSTMAKPIYTKNSSNGVYLWVNWPESYTEKLYAVDGLFLKSVDTKGEESNDLYINSLSGYYIDEDIKEGLYPFKNLYKTSHYSNGILGFGAGWYSGEIKVSNMGKGGDHVSLAYDLNKYVYGILNGDTPLSSTGEYLPEGPWGLVMMEHIGNTTKGSDDKSVDLVDLIMMNNFKFPLATKPVVDNGGGSTPTTKEAEVTFSNEPASAEGAIH